LLPTSDDSWLSISESDLDYLLHSKWGSERTGSKTTSGTGSDNNGGGHKISGRGDFTKLQSAVYGMNSFVDKVSAHSGAEFPW